MILSDEWDERIVYVGLERIGREPIMIYFNVLSRYFLRRTDEINLISGLPAEIRTQGLSNTKHYTSVLGKNIPSKVFQFLMFKNVTDVRTASIMFP
jgi:hypothetical protein